MIPFPNPFALFRRCDGLLTERLGPDWPLNIDLDTLDLGSGTGCVWGQLAQTEIDHWSGFATMSERLGIESKKQWKYGVIEKDFHFHDGDSDWDLDVMDGYRQVGSSDFYETLTDLWQIYLGDHPAIVALHLMQQIDAGLHV